jgi:hypothetical protein
VNTISTSSTNRLLGLLKTTGVATAYLLRSLGPIREPKSVDWPDRQRELARLTWMSPTGHERSLATTFLSTFKRPFYPANGLSIREGERCFIGHDSQFVPLKGAQRLRRGEAFWCETGNDVETKRARSTTCPVGAVRALLLAVARKNAYNVQSGPPLTRRR